MSGEGRAGALMLRSPMMRQRPWISDGVWIAHESLPLFHRLAAVMPGPGWWRLGPNGASLDPGPKSIDLAAAVADIVARSSPCIVNHDDYRRSATIDQAMEAASDQRAEVLDQAGRVWHFDLDFIEAATIGQESWTWQLAIHNKGVALLGIDRKSRPRFVVMNLDEADS